MNHPHRERPARTEAHGHPWADASADPLAEIRELSERLRRTRFRPIRIPEEVTATFRTLPDDALRQIITTPPSVDGEGEGVAGPEYRLSVRWNDGSGQRCSWTCRGSMAETTQAWLELRSYAVAAAYERGGLGSTKYSGPCRSGPCDGEWRESEAAEFEVLVRASVQPWGKLVTETRHLYRWHRTDRAWDHAVPASV